MEERHFNSAEEFLEIFELGEEDNHYYDPIIFSDAKAGFSIKRNYPKNIRYKPPLNRTGEPDSVAMFWINYTHPDDVRNFAKHEGTSRGVPIVVIIQKLSKYLVNHFDYDNDNDESPTSEEVEASNRTRQPISQEFFSDFYYNHEEKRFIDTQGRQYRPRELLDHIFKLHCNTVHPWKGLWLRTRLACRGKALEILPRLSGFIIWFLKVFFGRTPVNDDIMYIYSRGCQNEDFKRQNENTIEVFGYRASRSTIILFCVIILIMGFLAYSGKYTEGPVAYILNNSIMSLASAIVMLWILDVLAPCAIIKSLSFIIRFRRYLFLKEF